VNPPTGPVLDLQTVITVLYVSPYTKADWHRFGPARLAQYVTALAADPEFRVPELVTLVATARELGPPFVHAGHLADAERHAPRVLVALTN
jgi:hypothetical protein